MSLASGVRLGGYEIVALIGAGGMGEVYRAHDTRLDRDVAIKILAGHVANDPEDARADVFALGTILNLASSFPFRSLERLIAVSTVVVRAPTGERMRTSSSLNGL